VGTGDARNLSTAPNCGGAGFTGILKLLNSTQEIVVDSGGIHDRIGYSDGGSQRRRSACSGTAVTVWRGVDNTVIINPSSNSASIGDGVTGERAVNVVVSSEAPANVIRIRLKFGVVRSGRFSF